MAARIEMATKQILSICIPTYNMGYKVTKTVNYLLKCSDSRFNIIVLDNCSTDNSYLLLSQLESEKVLIRQNDINVGASLNYIRSLCLSTAKFCMTLLDKDFLDINVLPEFLDFLEKEDEIFGYCELYYEKDKKHDFIKLNKGFESIESMAYLSKHPTGYFYNTKILKESINERYYKYIDHTIPFPYEIINAHLGVYYNSYKVFLPLCYPESRKHNSTKSMSYSEDNLFYAPKRRCIEYSAYLNDVLSLDIEKWQAKKIIENLYKRFLGMVSLGYKDCMCDDFLCNHYNVAKRKVSITEQIHNSRLILKLTKSAMKKRYSPFGSFLFTEFLFIIHTLRVLKYSC